MTISVSVIYVDLIDTNSFIAVLVICSVPDNGESDIHVDQSSLSTKTSAVEWFVIYVMFCVI